MGFALKPKPNIRLANSIFYPYGSESELGQYSIMYLFAQHRLTCCINYLECKIYILFI